ncbi:leucine-rich repeat domain-containing protein, partial [Mycoplasma sp. VS410B]|uniref:leucine-rich repeat domain-containing protein n=1 Tax=Mycoplasma sp. VS410B TaxID=3401688 RepID=UPI003AAC54F5
MHKNKKIFIGALVGSAISLPLISASCGSDKENKISELEKEIKNLQVKLGKNESDLDREKNTNSELNNKILEKDKQLKNLADTINSTIPKYNVANDTITFSCYPDTDKKIDVLYDKKNKTMTLSGAKTINNALLTSIDNALSKFLHSAEKVTLISNDTTRIDPYITQLSFMEIIDLQLPKLIEVSSSSDHNLKNLFNYLQASKVIQNGILLKWSGAFGEINDDQVTAIAPEVFSGNESITSASFINVKNIGASSFKGCRKLKSIHFPNAITIEKSAFKNCDLNSAIFDKVQTINDSVFEENTNLVTALFPKAIAIGNNAFKSAHKLIATDFNKCQTIGDEAFYSVDKLLSINLPNVTSIGNDSFAYSRSLVEIHCPNVTSVGERAFSGTKLKNVSLQKLVKLGESAFIECENLEAVDFPLLNHIETNTFRNCTNLSSVRIPNSLIVGENAFLNTENLHKIELNNVLKIETEAFKNSGLENINFSKLEYIGAEAFKNNKKLTTVTLPKVTTIHAKAFEEDASLETINIPNVVYIDNEAFYSALNINEITLPRAKSIGYKAFSNISHLKSFIAPELSIISDYALAYNQDLVTVKIPNAEIIGSYALSDNQSLTTVKMNKKVKFGLNVFYKSNELDITTRQLIASAIGGKKIYNNTLVGWSDATGHIVDDTVTSIADGVFANNQNITSVSFPNVTSIGDNAFAGATNLTSVDIPKLNKVGLHAFENTPKLIGKIIVDGKLIRWDGASGDIADDSITSIADSVFENNEKITSVSFPNVTTIGTRTFYGATNLKNISLDNVENIGNNSFDNIPNINIAHLLDATSKLKDKLIINGELIKWSGANGSIRDDSITSIYNNVFKDNTKIISVLFPNVKTIGEQSFSGATNLTSVDIPKLNKVGLHAFENTPKLIGKIIVDGKLIRWDGASGDIADDSITSIADSVFENNEKITSVS